MSKPITNNNIPLCVDLDGTYVRTDTLHEHLLTNVTQSTLKTLLSFKEILKGKAQFKAELSNIKDFSAAHLPINEQVVSLVSGQISERETILVTGASSQIATAVLKENDLFTSSISSDGLTNLTGENKRDRLVDEFGEKGYDYIGNDYVDWPVFESAQKGYLISRDKKLIEETQSRFEHVECILEKPRQLKDWLRLLRVHHWMKNILIFIPLFLEHRVFDLHLIWMSALCFIAFSLLASMTYLLNDLHDIRADRQNATKSNRPLASGLISISEGIRLAGCLFLIFTLLLFLLPKALIGVLIIYLLTTVSYTLYIKQILFLDVVTLACLQTLRIIAGIVAIDANYSFWVLSFSIFFFLSLALAKRVAELKNLRKENRTETVGRGYVVGDIDVIVPAGISAGNISVLIVALYINSEKVIQMYQAPQFLWIICLLLIYWLGRIWIVTARGYMTEDPLIYATKDRISLLTFLGFAFCIALALPT